ncbi:hypothetical protein RND81_07G149600 [Saponaria officinalis]|uniref:Uncharacterized protein n=1 Tax=Saponaria officinalis TaxID=3572 RepID=A0AAW1JUR7_SAPOF
MAFLLQNRCASIILLFHFLVYLSTTQNVCCAQNLKKQNVSNNSILAAFVFGDSTVDPGNNNYIKTLFKSDFLPYGVDFEGHTPTGRFSNGRLATDFIASYMGIKEAIPAYLDPNLSLEDLITGVSFASAGTGYDPLTAVKTSVIDMSKQLEYFDEYKKRIKSMIGKKRMNELMKRSAFVISCGSNDIIYTYGLVDSPLQPYTSPTYLRFLLDQSISFVQGLLDRGATKIAVVSLPPVGCVPAVIESHPSYNNNKPRQCVESLSSLAIDFNQMLQSELKTIQASKPTSTVIYADIYTPLQDQIYHPLKYGFEEVDKFCCGTGLLEGTFLCNALTNVCKDRSKYVFWDAIHPTERSYALIFEALRPLIDIILTKP